MTALRLPGICHCLALCVLMSCACSGFPGDLFADELMTIYGSNGTMTVDELQNLINTLKVTQNSTTEVISTEAPNHNRPTPACNRTAPSNRECLSDKCFSAYDMVNFAGGSNKSGLTRDDLISVGPAIMFTLQNRQCQSSNNEERHERGTLRKKKPKPSYTEVWGYSFLFVTAINLCSVVGIFVLPCMNKNFYKVVLMYMVALAVGSLAGSGLLFLIPDALGLSEIEEIKHNYVWKCTTVLGGIYLFFIVERLLKSITDWRKNKNTKKDSSRNLSVHGDLEYSNLHQPYSGSIKEHTPVETDPELKVPPNLSGDCDCTVPASTSSSVLLDNTPDIQLDVQVQDRSFHEEDFNHKMSKKVKREIAPVAWMIIFGDALHNFIDGLSIGAAFTESIFSGMSISLAVICEEFPHELGDFAILLNSGMSRRQALGYNFLSACTCYLGLILGIVLGEMTQASTWIFAIAGGMFLYISLADMMPEVNHAAEDEDNKHYGKLTIFIVQNLGILSGYGVMVLMAVYGEDIDFAQH